MTKSLSLSHAIAQSLAISAVLRRSTHTPCRSISLHYGVALRAILRPTLPHTHIDAEHFDWKFVLRCGHGMMEQTWNRMCCVHRLLPRVGGSLKSKKTNGDQDGEQELRSLSKRLGFSTCLRLNDQNQCWCESLDQKCVKPKRLDSDRSSCSSSWSPLVFFGFKKGTDSSRQYTAAE